MYKYELNLMEKYKDGKSEGINEGISIVEVNATNRMVKNLKDQGVSVEVIAKAANLTVEEVNRIH